MSASITGSRAGMAQESLLATKVIECPAFLNAQTAELDEKSQEPTGAPETGRGGTMDSFTI